MWQRVEFGVFGLIGYIPVFIGFVLIACINYMGSFIAPGLSEEEMASLQKGSAMMAAMISGLIMLVGEILFGIATFRTGIFPRIATVLFKIGFLGPLCARGLSNRHLHWSQYFRCGDHLVEYLPMVLAGGL